MSTRFFLPSHHFLQFAFQNGLPNRVYVATGGGSAGDAKSWHDLILKSFTNPKFSISADNQLRPYLVASAPLPCAKFNQFGECDPHCEESHDLHCYL